jgi:5-methylcytosine-specific restriction protein B
MAMHGLFMPEAQFDEALNALLEKKNLVLQGPPGVGKTFVAARIAKALVGVDDPTRIASIQFHQSYSYEDFIQGFRPTAKGTFDLRYGIFHQFCRRAQRDEATGRRYVFIIDEINRGNISQIFGELLMLIEPDKRGPEFALPLAYRTEDEPHFFVPPNLYLIGLLNVADRSLAMVDYAMRRRFVFITLKPQYGSPLFSEWLLERGMDPSLVQSIVERMTRLNQEIREDPLLGENYEIGHSFFLPKGDNFTGLDTSWYMRVVRTEIVPLLKEYWFDNPRRAEEAEKRLLA